MLVRDVGIPGWLRDTAGTDEETGAFLAALAEVIAQTQPLLPDPLTSPPDQQRTRQ